MNSPHLMVYMTAATQDEANALARLLLERRLVAGVNLVPINSMYWWQGAIQTSGEIMLVAQTRADAFDALQAAVKATHSYDTPAIVGIPITHGSPAYLKWIEDEVEQPRA